MKGNGYAAMAAGAGSTGHAQISAMMAFGTNFLVAVVLRFATSAMFALPTNTNANGCLLIVSNVTMLSQNNSALQQRFNSTTHDLKVPFPLIR